MLIFLTFPPPPPTSTRQLPTTSLIWSLPTILTTTSLPPSHPLQRRPAARRPSFPPSRPKPPSPSVRLATPCKTRTRILSFITAPIVAGAVARQNCACHSRATVACPIFTWPRAQVEGQHSRRCAVKNGVKTEGPDSYQWSGKEGSDKENVENAQPVAQAFPDVTEDMRG